MVLAEAAEWLAVCPPARPPMLGLDLHAELLKAAVRASVVAVCRQSATSGSNHQAKTDSTNC